MVEAIAFRGRIRFWRQDPPGGLAVIDVPTELVMKLGGRRQYRVEGTIQGSSFQGSTMLVAGGGFCVGVSRAGLDSAGAAVGDEVNVSIGAVARP
jgi:hypothetical protein